MKETEREKSVRKSLQELNLVDRFMFDEAVEREDVYEDMISILLGVDVKIDEKVETEKEKRVSPMLRSIRLDVVAQSEAGVMYYAEMQQQNTYNLPRRSRYYQAQMDVSLLQVGESDFNKLPDSCMILIAPFDLFGRGLYKYTFRGVCEECSDLKLQDGAYRIFINTKGTNDEAFSQEFLDFMKYITDSTDSVAEKTESARIKHIHNAVKNIRVSEKAGVRYLQRWEEIAMEREEERFSTLKRMVESKFTKEQMAMALGIKINDVDVMIEKMKSK